MERLDPRMGRWMSVPSMASRRSSAGVAVPNDGYLYCVGGNDGTMCLATGERYNPRRNVWEPIASMHSRRYLTILLRAVNDSVLQEHIIFY